MTGTTIKFLHSDSFGFGVQGSIQTSFREMLIVGTYDYLAGKGGFGTNGDLYVEYYQDPAWPGVSTHLDALFRSTAVCVDPFTTEGAFHGGLTWARVRLPPEMWGGTYDSGDGNHYYNYGDGTGIYNSDGVHLYNVNMARWYVGFGRIGGDSNSEWNTWEGQNSSTSYVIFGMMNTGSQSRQPVANSVKFQNFFCAITGQSGLNPNIGNLQSTFKDCHFGFGIKLIDAKLGWAGPIKFDGCYAESISHIGTADTLTLDNCYLSLREQDVQYGVPDFHADVAQLVLQGGTLVLTKNGLFVRGNASAYGSNSQVFWRDYSDVAQAATSTTITLGAGTPQGDNFFNNMPIYIQTGTGAGQVRTISGYVASTKVATISSAWTTTPDTTSVYITGQDVSGFALALGSGARGCIFATGNVELHAHNQGTQAAVARDHSTFLGVWVGGNYPPTEVDTKSPKYWVQPFQTSSSSAHYRKTYEQRFVGAQNASAPLAFDNAAVPNLTTIAHYVNVNSRSGKDLTCDRFSPATNVKADIGDVFGISASDPDRLTWFICIAINTAGDKMILRQISNYYENWYGPTLYAAVVGSATPEVAGPAGYGNSQYQCSRVFDVSMYGFIGTTSTSSITGLKSRQTGAFPTLPDRTFPFRTGDTFIATENSDAWLGSSYTTYALISGVSGTTMSFSGSPSLPTTAIVRPRFGIRNFNA